MLRCAYTDGQKEEFDAKTYSEAEEIAATWPYGKRQFTVLSLGIVDHHKAKELSALVYEIILFVDRMPVHMRPKLISVAQDLAREVQKFL